MADPSCSGPNCHFTGDDDSSTADPGRCTRTPGILANAEISRILGLGIDEKSYYDQGSDSNVLVYNSTWVGYMDDDTMASRIDYYRSLNFRGFVNWATDLAEFSGDDGNPSGEWQEPPLPDVSECTATFDSLEALGDASGGIPAHCATQYTVQTLSNLFSAAMDNYTEMVHNDYSEKFQIYAEAVAGNAGETVHDYVYNHGNEYFSCTVMESPPCCHLCETLPSLKHHTCAYCWTDGDCYTTCSVLACGPGAARVPDLRTVNVSEPCPPDYSERGTTLNHGQSVYWSLQDDKTAEFYKAIFDETGIGKDNLKFGNYDRGNSCPPSASIGDGDSCWSIDMDYNIPKPDGYDASDVANPKSTVKKALERSGELGPQISKTLTELACDAWFGDGSELIDSISLPILMIADAVENMGQVVEIAHEITQAEQRMIIAAFLSAILFMIPIAGEVLGSIAGMARIGAMIAMAGEAANLAVGVYEMVDNPDNGPLAIMNLVFAPAALADFGNIAKAAKIRREMKHEDIAKLGTKVSGRLDSIKKLTGRCFS